MYVERPANSNPLIFHCHCRAVRAAKELCIRKSDRQESLEQNTGQPQRVRAWKPVRAQSFYKMNDDVDPLMRPPPQWKKKPRPTPPHQPSSVTSGTVGYVVLVIAVLVSIYIGLFHSPSSRIDPFLLTTDLVNVKAHHNAAFRALQHCDHSLCQTVIASLEVLTASISRSGQQCDRLASHVTGGLTAHFRKAGKTRKCAHLETAYASFFTAENYTHEAEHTLKASLALYNDTESLIISAYDDTQAMRTRLIKTAPFPLARNFLQLAGTMVGWSPRTVTEKVQEYGMIEHWSTIYQEVASDLHADRETVRLEVHRLGRFAADMKLIKDSILISLEGQNSSDIHCSTFDFETSERFFHDAIRRLAGHHAEAESFHSSL